MKKIITTEETATAWSPWKVESKEFIQIAYTEAIEALVKSIVGPSYSSSVPYIIEGCVISGAGPYNITAGKIVYNGVYYSVSAGTSLAAPIEFQLETTADATADPTTFSDGTQGHEIHLDYHFTPYGATLAPSASFDQTALKSVYGNWTSYTPTLTCTDNLNSNVPGGFVGTATGRYLNNGSTLDLIMDITAVETLVNSYNLQMSLPISVPTPLLAEGYGVCRYFDGTNTLFTDVRIKLNYTGSGTALTISKITGGTFGAATGGNVSFSLRIAFR